MTLQEFQNRLRYDHRTKSFIKEVPKTSRVYVIKKRTYNKHVRYKDLYENIEWGLDWILYHQIYPVSPKQVKLIATNLRQ